ncbi:hypothetical protein V8E54_007176 [Elaphomyces granulatus]
MSSIVGQLPGAAKAGNSSNPPVSSSASFQSASGAVDSGSQRRPGGSGSFGAGATSRNAPSARNNQPRKNQHRRQRRPGLGQEDVPEESAIMRSTTSRKGQTSITHLMRFALPPRPQHHHNPSHGGGQRNVSWGLGSGYHAVDKARYVHANYRFIVHPQRSYHAQAANADVHLDWDSVLQVLASPQTQAASCPICLSMSVAPRMAKCGHIFCCPCLIRYMHSGEDENPLPEKKPRWKKCPICWDTVYVSDTRPVRWFTGQVGELPVEGGDVVMRLAKRRPGSTLALPRDGAEELGPDEDIPWYHAAEVIDYARIMKGGEDYMIAQYNAEIEDLKRQEQEDELLFGDDTMWTRKAIIGINEAKGKMRGIGNPPDVSRVEERLARDHIKFEDPPEGVPSMYNYQLKSGRSSSTESFSSPAGMAYSTGDSPVTASTSVDTEKLSTAIANMKTELDPDAERELGDGSLTTTLRVRPRDAGPHPTNQPYYFYQALPHFYLSPLDIRILKAAFGDYPLFPATILPRVEHISTGHVVDDELRKRAKYLGHLPYGCEVTFLECDWTDLVMPGVLEQFKPETEKRRRRNREKEVREEKDRLRAEKEEEEKRWAAARRKRSSHDAGTRPFSDKDFLPLSRADATDTDAPAVAAGILSSSPPQWGSNAQSRFDALASPSTSPPAPRTVWGTAAVAPSSPRSEPIQPPPVNDGWFQGWESSLSEHDHQMLVSSTVTNRDMPISASGGNSKKKKGKKITLMSTNIQRGA